MVKNFGSLQQQVQIVKDSYYKLIKNAAAGMSHEYKILNGKVEAAIKELEKYPSELNTHNRNKLYELKRYCTDRIIGEPVLEYSISCKNSGYSLSDILNYSALLQTKDSELLITKSNFITETPKTESKSESNHDQNFSTKKPRKIHFSVPGKVITVREYKILLTGQLSSLAAAEPDEKIELEIETVKEDPSS